MAPVKDQVAPDGPANCKVVLAGSIAKGLLAEVQAGLKQLGRSPNLLGILANDDPAALVYADWTEKTCIENGFTYTRKVVDKDNVEETIMAANNDASVDGMIVYYPIFGSGQDSYLQQIVDISKDVEGLSHRYIFNMYQNIRFLDGPEGVGNSSNSDGQKKIVSNGDSNGEQKSNGPESTNIITKTTPSKAIGTGTGAGARVGGDNGTRPKSILPCTPLAILKTLAHLKIYNTILPEGNQLHGRTILIINRSEVVGRPLAALLANDGATVYSVDVTQTIQLFTRGSGLRNRKHQVIVLDAEQWTLARCAALADVVITGVPVEEYKFDCDLLRDGAVCVNFASHKNFDGVKVKEKASIYVPAIGKVTIAVLLRNLLRIVQNRDIAATTTTTSTTTTTN